MLGENCLSLGVVKIGWLGNFYRCTKTHKTGTETWNPRSFRWFVISERDIMFSFWGVGQGKRWVLGRGNVLRWFRPIWHHILNIERLQKWSVTTSLTVNLPKTKQNKTKQQHIPGPNEPGTCGGTRLQLTGTFCRVLSCHCYKLWYYQKQWQQINTYIIFTYMYSIQNRNIVYIYLWHIMICIHSYYPFKFANRFISGEGFWYQITIHHLYYSQNTRLETICFKIFQAMHPLSSSSSV